MGAQVLVITGDVGAEVAAMCHQLTQALADALRQPVAYGRGDPDEVAVAIERAEVRVNLTTLVPMPPPAPMAAAEMLYLPDGRPDWSSMWQGFCELALFGGPPHRGEDSALRHVEDGAGTAPEFDAITEIRRGIYDTTGMYSELSDMDGWLEVTCDSPKMAAWMAASILLENVDARFDEERLLVPAHPSFELKNEVKSVITVVAKVHHYWIEHARATVAQA